MSSRKYVLMISKGSVWPYDFSVICDFTRRFGESCFFKCTFATSGDTFEEYAASFLAPNQTSQHKIREFHSSEVKTI